jgi:hypothetical protein
MIATAMKIDRPSIQPYLKPYCQMPIAKDMAAAIRSRMTK